MAIKKPGERFRYNKLLKRKFEGKRAVTATLSLTAMVDMFTVLVIFLLQNYNTSEVIIELHDVELPQAHQTKELKPAHVVTINIDKEETRYGKGKKKTGYLMLESQRIMKTSAVQRQEQWLLVPLRDKLRRAIPLKKKEFEMKQKSQIRTALGKETDIRDWRKVTVQADKDVDILTVKKVMYTVTEAGASEVNFAVVKEVEKK